MTFIIVFQVKPLQALLQVLQYKAQLIANLFHIKDEADTTEIFMKTNNKSHNLLTRNFEIFFDCLLSNIVAYSAQSSDCIGL